MITPLEFWYDCIGRHLVPQATPMEAVAAILPTRTLKGVKGLRIGAIDAFYIARPGASQLISRIELPSTPALRQVAGETVSARKHIAQWLLDEAATPFLLGVIGNANPVASLQVSAAPSHCRFCESGAGFGFDLGRVRTARAQFATFPWKTVAATAIHQYWRCRLSTQPGGNEQKKLFALFDKHPGLRRAVIDADVKPNSGEYAILSWLNIDRQPTQSEALA